MSSPLQRLTVSTPGRICLFGEHQDYLRLPVIASAISLRISIDGRRRIDDLVTLSLPDIHSRESFQLKLPLKYVKERDYYRSALNVLARSGFSFSSGFDCTVHGTIPINAGTSSSSALMVSWIQFLSQMSDQGLMLSFEECARYAHSAEVLEFGEPGGMMDHYSTALGGALFLEFHPAVKIERLPSPPGVFVLGDSEEPKDTKSILSRVKNRVIAISERLQQDDPKFSLHTLSLADVGRYKRALDDEEFGLLNATVVNHELTLHARRLLLADVFDGVSFGSLLNRHQNTLRDVLKISTPKIDRMLDAALNAGAHGGKINGSGGGGCMFVYAPDQTEQVAEAIERAGGKAYIVTVDRGTRNEA